MNGNKRSGFDPVLLDLAESDDYVVLVQALEDYAASHDARAEEEQENARFDGLPDSGSEEHRLRNLATRARRIATSIEQQLDANSAARHAVEASDNGIAD